MIVTKFKPQEEILELIQNDTNIFIVGCGSCAEQCRTGGQQDVKEMKKRLEKNNKKITGWVVPDETCNIPLVKKELRACIADVKKADCILIMACGAGVSAVKEAVSKRVFPALDTVSLANTLRRGDFVGKCSLCGECVLGETGGLCPVTICPKGMLNGPCGGMGGGKCEVDTDSDCVWVKIYDTLQECGDIAKMKKISAPKDYSKMQRSTRICLPRPS